MHQCKVLYLVLHPATQTNGDLYFMDDVTEDVGNLNSCVRVEGTNLNALWC